MAGQQREAPPRGPILVAGAGGFLGRAVVRAISEAGHPVRGLITASSKAGAVRTAGGEPVVGSVLELPSVLKASAGCSAIVHVASTHATDPTDVDRVRRVRVEGTTNLVAAARSNRVPRLVVGSGYWVYADQPATILESSPVDPRGESRINYDAERAGLEAASRSDLEVCVVRPGMVYGDGAWFRPVVDSILAGTYRIIGAGTNHWSFVSLPDTGTGFAAVVERGAPSETYNLVDGHPVPWVEFARFVAKQLGKPAPGATPREEAVSVYGAAIAHHLAANRAASSDKLRALGWAPSFPRYEAGVEAVLHDMGLGS